MKLSLVPSDDGIRRIVVHGSITLADISAGEDLLEPLLESAGYAQAVVVDFEHTEYIDSAGIGWLLGRHRRFRENGGRMVIYSIPPLVAQVLQIMHLERVLSLAENLDAALEIAGRAQS